MNHQPYSDKDYLDAFRYSDEVGLLHFRREYLPRTMAQICKQGGDEHDAVDVFQEAQIALFLKVQDSAFELTCKLSTFFYALCQNQWLNFLRKKKKDVGVRLEDLNLSTDEKHLIVHMLEGKDRMDFFYRMFNKLGENCKKLLELALIQETPAEEIIRIMGYGSLSYLYKRKSDCKEKLNGFILNDPEVNDWLS